MSWNAGVVLIIYSTQQINKKKASTSMSSVSKAPEKKKNIHPMWSWSYGSWISNFICNQCLSPLMLWVRTPLRRGVLVTTLCYKVCQWLATGPWFSLGTSVSPTNKTDPQVIARIISLIMIWFLNVIRLTAL